MQLVVGATCSSVFCWGLLVHLYYLSLMLLSVQQFAHTHLCCVSQQSSVGKE